MQTIEEPPPAMVEEKELEQLALSYPHPDTQPIQKPRFSIWRVLFWTVVVFGAIVIGGTILALPKFTLC